MQLQVTAIASELATLLNRGIATGVFPGAAAGVILGPPENRKRITLWRGNGAILPKPWPIASDTRFDLASLTKPLATTMAVLALMGGGQLALDHCLSGLLERPVPASKAKITLRHLLNHSSGLPAHRPYFERLRTMATADRNKTLDDWLLAEPLEREPGHATVYSDLGFMLLGRIVAIKAGMSLNQVVAEQVTGPLGLAARLFFRPLPADPPAHRFAATEDCPWRGKILAGEVHDDNAHALGGVAGHAGLFGDLAAVLAMTCHLLNQWHGRAEHPFIRTDDLRAFLKRDEAVAGSTWALGFDTPSAVGSSGGSYLSAKSVGHLGFTGTSFWIDPDRDLVAVLLTNRVHPHRSNTKIREFRPLFHDTVIRLLGLLSPQRKKL